MNIPIFVREFNAEKVISTTTNKYHISSYFPTPMKTSLEIIKKDIPNDQYILCPLYNKDDFQLGITGKLKRGENEYKALQREMQEEIGLTPLDRTAEIIASFPWRTNGHFSVFFTNISDCEIKHVNSNTDIDNFNKKIGCYVYGSKEDIIKFLKSKELYEFSSSDSIVGIVAIKLKDIPIK